MKRLPSSQCASVIQIVWPWASTAETQPQLQPALLRLSAIISEYVMRHLTRINELHLTRQLRPYSRVHFRRVGHTCMRTRSGPLSIPRRYASGSRTIVSASWKLSCHPVVRSRCTLTLLISFMSWREVGIATRQEMARSRRARSKRRRYLS